MNKQDLIDAIAGKTGLIKKGVADVIDVLSETITESLKAGNEVDIPKIGKLSPTTRAARMGRNPKTGEEVEIAARVAVKLKPAKALRDALNG